MNPSEFLEPVEAPRYYLEALECLVIAMMKSAPVDYFPTAFQIAEMVHDERQRRGEDPHPPDLTMLGMEP